LKEPRGLCRTRLDGRVNFKGDLMADKASRKFLGVQPTAEATKARKKLDALRAKQRAESFKSVKQLFTFNKENS